MGSTPQRFDGTTHLGNADRAAVALAGQLPLASDDGIFDNVDELELVTP